MNDSSEHDDAESDCNDVDGAMDLLSKIGNAVESKTVTDLERSELEQKAELLLNQLTLNDPRVQTARAALLMRCFYEHWRVEGFTKVEALQQAQIDLLRGVRTGVAKPTIDAATHARGMSTGEVVSDLSPSVDFSHPYHWAPFILMGNPL